MVKAMTLLTYDYEGSCHSNPVTLVLSQKRCQDKTLVEQPVKLGLMDAAEAILMI